MSAIFLLIAVSLLVAGGFLAAFFWSVSNGQMDDAYTPGMRILFDDREERAAEEPERPAEASPQAS